MDVYDAQTRSAVMRAVKAKDTKPEMIVRRLLHRAGYRFRLHRANLPGKPDLTFPSRRKVIFVHGCFWHQHPGCRAADRPSSNTAYWRAKLDRNMERDKTTQEALERGGWRTLIVWECQTRNPDALLTLLTDFLNRDE
jgi:DNA mismatch endonuclease, patch repair protein